jgi:hypothetical protein
MERMSCTSINFYLHKNWIRALKQAQVSTPDHIYNTLYLLNLNFFKLFVVSQSKAQGIVFIFYFLHISIYYRKRNFMLIPMQQSIFQPGQNWWSCEAFCSTAIRGISCMCEVSWSHVMFWSNQSVWTRYLSIVNIVPQARLPSPLVLYNRYLGQELMPVLELRHCEPYCSGSDTCATTLVRLRLWEGQVPKHI